MSETITTWSFSGWKEYCQCPFKSYLKRIKKLKEPGSPAMDRGTAIHQIAQDYVEGKNEALNQNGRDLTPFQRQFDMLKKFGAACELEWGFTASWQPTGFHAPDVWLRVKTDATYYLTPTTLVVIDYKTGKIYDDHKDQLHLYATSAFVKFPHVETILAQDWYLDQNCVTEETFQSQYAKAMINDWNGRVASMLRDAIFAKRPGPLCRFCHFRRGNGGECEF